MKKLTKRVAALLSIGCAAFLGIFLPSCGKSEEEGEDKDDISLAYGCPYVDFDVKVRVQTPDGKPIEGVEVTLLERSYESDGDFVSWSEIGRTDANGVAQISDSQTAFDVEKLYVQAVDGDGLVSRNNQKRDHPDDGAGLQQKVFEVSDRLRSFPSEILDEKTHHNGFNLVK